MRPNIQRNIVANWFLLEPKHAKSRAQKKFETENGERFFCAPSYETDE